MLFRSNDELGELVRALVGAEALLKPGGRLVVVTFHSLEDRIVKQYFAERSNRGRAKSRLLPGEIAPPPAAYDLPTGQPVVAGEAETARNPRARSAKLRVGVRTQAPASPARGAFASQAALPQREPKRG